MRISDWSSDVCSSDLGAPIWIIRSDREGIDASVDRLCAPHPRLGPDAPHPIGEARDEAEILAHMLFADQADRHHAAGRRGDGRAEKALQHEDAFGMMRSEEHTSELQSLMRISYA